MILKKTIDINRNEILGIVAGQGKFPLMIAREAKKQGIQVFVIGIEGYSPREIVDTADEIQWYELGQVSHMLNALKENNIKQVALAGRVPHDALLHYKRFDKFSLGLLSLLGDKKANSILKMVSAVLSKNGIRVVDCSTLLGQYTPGKGLLTPNRRLLPDEEQEIKFGLPLAKKIADMDIGLTIVVKNQIVVAVEAMDGTDKTIERGAELAGEGVIVIKVARPKQDPRWDLPVIGLKTIRVMSEVKAAAIAITANKTLFFDQDEAIPLAERSNIAITAI
jgi:DUF1009 family protein